MYSAHNERVLLFNSISTWINVFHVVYFRWLKEPRYVDALYGELNMTQIRIFTEGEKKWRKEICSTVLATIINTAVFCEKNETNEFILNFIIYLKMSSFQESFVRNRNKNFISACNTNAISANDCYGRIDTCWIINI